MAPKKYLWAAVAWTSFILVMCLIKMAALEELDPLHFEGQDKVVHCLFYFIFTLLWGLYSRTRRGFLTWRALGAVFIVAVAYGAFIELLQANLTTNRTADVADAVANTLGSLLASVMLAVIFRKDRNII